jgi:hypothetical protein
MLRALEAKGKIELPARLAPSRSGGGSDVIKETEHDTSPVNTDLKELLPLRTEVPADRKEVGVFKSYIAAYHYLGYGRSVGENMKYAVYSRDGVLLACLLFGSAAWTLKPRDEYIGWEKESRMRNLCFVTNNTRFLIPPWVTVPNLASHVLSLAARRICGDWESKYGHPVYLLETFVERERFSGTCYKASNWIRAGVTAGFGRNNRGNAKVLPEKDIYLCPLRRDFKKKLRNIPEEQCFGLHRRRESE